MNPVATPDGAKVYVCLQNGMPHLSALSPDGRFSTLPIWVPPAGMEMKLFVLMTPSEAKAVLPEGQYFFRVGVIAFPVTNEGLLRDGSDLCHRVLTVSHAEQAPLDPEETVTSADGTKRYLGFLGTTDILQFAPEASNVRCVQVRQNLLSAL